MTNDTELARGYQLDINTGDDVTPQWVEIRGWTNISPSPETETTDDSHANSGGWAGHKVAQRGLSLGVDLLTLRDSTGALDPGQQALRDAAEAIGIGSNVPFRYFHKGTGEGHTFDASVELAWPGGGHNDDAAYSATITVDGKPQPVTVTPV